MTVVLKHMLSIAIFSIKITLLSRHFKVFNIKPRIWASCKRLYYLFKRCVHVPTDNIWINYNDITSSGSIYAWYIWHMYIKYMKNYLKKHIIGTLVGVDIVLDACCSVNLQLVK